MLLPYNTTEVCVAPVRGSGRGQWDSRRVAVQQPHSEYWQPASMDSEGTGVGEGRLGEGRVGDGGGR